MGTVGLASAVGSDVGKGKNNAIFNLPFPPLNEEPTWHCSEVIQLDELSGPGLPPRVGAGLEGATKKRG